MFRRSRYMRDLADLQKRMRMFEQKLERLNGSAIKQSKNTIASLWRGSDRMSDAIASLTEAADRVRDSARSATNEATRFGRKAAHLSENGLERVSHEIGEHPFAAMAAVAGIGILIGFAARRH